MDGQNQKENRSRLRPAFAPAMDGVVGGNEGDGDKSDVGVKKGRKYLADKVTRCPSAGSRSPCSVCVEPLTFKDGSESRGVDSLVDEGRRTECMRTSCVEVKKQHPCRYLLQVGTRAACQNNVPSTFTVKSYLKLYNVYQPL